MKFEDSDSGDALKYYNELMEYFGLKKHHKNSEVVLFSINQLVI